ncbi:hypothetical protein ACFL0N_04650 [Pseudomonadota bacterium]
MSKLGMQNSYIPAMLMLAIFTLLTWQRDEAQVGPQHDEVIALLAAKGLEHEYFWRNLL